MTSAFVCAVTGAAVAGLCLLLASARVLDVHERAVILRLGRFVGTKGPRPFLVMPFVDRLVKVSVRTEAVTIPNQEVITRDSVTLQVDAVAFITVADPVQAVMTVDDYRYATYQATQTALRTIVGRFDLDELLAQRDEVNQQLQRSVTPVAEAMGISLNLLELRDLQVPEAMRRAMARQAEAERELRAKVILAQGESEAAEALSRTAALLQQSPGAMQLKMLSTMAEVARSPNSTLIFPLPMELLRLIDGVNAGADASWR